MVVVIALLLIGGTLATSGGGILRSGGRLGVAAPTSVPPSAVASPGPDAARAFAAVTFQPDAVPTIEPTRPSRFRCENSVIIDASRSSWRLQTVRAGKRKHVERVTLALVRAGQARHAARATITWMSPSEARQTFGLPRFDGQRGLLVSFSGPLRMTGSQLIGEVDLSQEGMRSVSGIYRFVEFDGGIRVFIALRDRSCADIRAPQFEGQDSGSRAGVIRIDLGRT